MPDIRNEATTNVRVNDDTMDTTYSPGAFKENSIGEEDLEDESKGMGLDIAPSSYRIQASAVSPIVTIRTVAASLLQEVAGIAIVCWVLRMVKVESSGGRAAQVRCLLSP
jgi:hypothetical protein